MFLKYQYKIINTTPFIIDRNINCKPIPAECLEVSISHQSEQFTRKNQMVGNISKDARKGEAFLLIVL